MHFQNFVCVCANIIYKGEFIPVYIYIYIYIYMGGAGINF